jgi:hypothetical protein
MTSSMRNLLKVIGFALAAFVWFNVLGRLPILSWGFAGIFLWVLPAAALAIVALGYGVQAAADTILRIRERWHHE